MLAKLIILFNIIIFGNNNWIYSSNCKYFFNKKLVPNSFIVHTDFYYFILDSFSNFDINCEKINGSILDLELYLTHLTLLNYTFKDYNFNQVMYLVIFNVLGFDLNSSLVTYPNPQLTVEYSNLDFYSNGALVNTDCSYYNPDQQNFMFYFEAVFFLLGVKYTQNYCPFYFFGNQLELKFYYLSKSFIKNNYLSFSSPNYTINEISSNICLAIMRAYNIDIDESIYNFVLFMNINETFLGGNLNKIDSNIFNVFQNLKK